MKSTGAQKPAPRVLVLDGETRSALAVTRSLGTHGIEIAVVAHRRPALAASSRSCQIFFPVSDPRKDERAYFDAILGLISVWKPTMVIPTTDLSLGILIARAEEVSKHTILPTVSSVCFSLVQDKHRLLEFAKGLGLNIPDTLLVPSFATRTHDDVMRIKSFNYPAVLKAQSTESAHDNAHVKPGVYYPENADEALSLVSVSTFGPHAQIPFLLQERIQGAGVGVFALCKEGDPLAVFCHRRILEKPPTGGPSVLSESITEAEAPVEDALKLLKALRWEGVAMVEFKRAQNGKCYLMEINPRFWGSLQLAVDSGRDFPYLLFKAFTSEDLSTSELRQSYYQSFPGYQVGTRLRWILGTLDHFLIKLKANPLSTLMDLFLRNSLQIHRKPKHTYLETARNGDYGPFFAELRLYFADSFGSKNK